MMLKYRDVEIRKLADTGMNYKDVAEKMGVSYGGLYAYMKDKGIPLNSMPHGVNRRYRRSNNAEK